MFTSKLIYCLGAGYTYIHTQHIKYHSEKGFTEQSWVLGIDYL